MNFLSFEDFNISENTFNHLYSIFESGLITGKYDFSEITEACIYAIRSSIKHKEFQLQKDEVLVLMSVDLANNFSSSRNIVKFKENRKHYDQDKKNNEKEIEDILSSKSFKPGKLLNLYLDTFWKFTIKVINSNENETAIKFISTDRIEIKELSGTLGAAFIKDWAKIIGKQENEAKDIKEAIIPTDSLKALTLKYHKDRIKSIDYHNHNTPPKNEPLNKKLTIVYDPNEYSLASYGGNCVSLSKDVLLKSEISTEMIIAHEITHALDPGISSLERKNPQLKLSTNDYSNWIASAFDRVEKGDKTEWYKDYMRRTTEIEAHVEMFVYMTNFLLIKHPGKVEAVKAILRNGDWKIDKVFPELKELIEHSKERIDKFGKVKNKMLQRLGTLVSDLKHPGVKPTFEIILSKQKQSSSGYNIKKVTNSVTREQILKEMLNKFKNSRIEQ
jgi:hypothetical protein